MSVAAAKPIDSIKLTPPNVITPPENRMVIKEVLQSNQLTKQLDLHARRDNLEFRFSPISTAPGTLYKLQYIILVIECQGNYIMMSPVNHGWERMDRRGPKKSSCAVP